MAAVLSKLEKSAIGEEAVLTGLAFAAARRAHRRRSTDRRRYTRRRND